MPPTDDRVGLEVKVTVVLHGETLRTPYFMNYLSSLDKTYSE